jgi:hypothetical protein
MRIVPVEGRYGEMVTRGLDPIQFYSLLQKRFQTVEIDLRDDMGSIVPFQRGRTDTVLSPVQKRLQTVEIELRDDTGYIVPFQRGRMVVTLHCRKRKNSL